MARSSHIVIHVAALTTALMLTACSASSYNYDEPERDDEPVAVDPARACAALVAAPRGLAQEKAAELGCVEVGNNVWEYQGESPRAPAPAVESQPGGGISWNQAVGYAGTIQRVCGPLVGSGNSDDDVFLNLGLDYPDSSRFQIVIWDIGGLEPIPYGSTLCTSGQITLYEGVAQIELTDPTLIAIYN